MNLPLLPVWIMDVGGSAFMILFAFICVHLASRLKRRDPSDVLWTYILLFCLALAAFAVSRSVGHIAKRLLLSAGHADVWQLLKPYSGAVNTVTFVVVGSLTLFFNRTWGIYERIRQDKEVLQNTHEQLLFVNRNLEDLVDERTLELAYSERKYRRIFELSPDTLAVVTEEGLIVDLNPAGRRMFGLAGSDALFQLASLRLPDFLLNPEDWQSLRETLLSRRVLPDTEVELKRLNDGLFSALLSATQDEGNEATPPTFHFFIKDISQRKAMERHLQQTDKLASIGQLAAGIAHEINNPLSMVLGYTQLILRQEEPSTQRYADLKIVEKHARTCKTIVGDLLSFARSTRRQTGPTDFNKALGEILSVVRHPFELDGVVLEAVVDPNIPTMILDGPKIKQVFMNLIMNAKQAIGKNGTVKVTTRFDAEAEQVFASVQDTGCGIEPEHLQRIFDPFFTTKNPGEGTGLGLSVSYGIVKDHGGDIFVESTSGEGSTFTVVLPLKRETMVAEAEDAE